MTQTTITQKNIVSFFQKRMKTVLDFRCDDYRGEEERLATELGFTRTGLRKWSTLSLKEIKDAILYERKKGVE